MYQMAQQVQSLTDGEWGEITTTKLFFDYKKNID